MLPALCGFRRGNRWAVRGDRPQSGIRLCPRLRGADRRCTDRAERESRMTALLQFMRHCMVQAAALPATLFLLVQAEPALAQSPENILTYKGSDRVQRLIDGARKEGQVVIYSALIVNQAMRPIVEKFGKKYPFVKLSYWRADSEDITAKLAAEVRANNVVADVFEGTGVGEQAVEARLALPYYTPAIEAFPVEYRDPAGMWTPGRPSY